MIEEVKIISLGGSLVCPLWPDVQFLKDLKKLFQRYFLEYPHKKFVLVIGGGNLARVYQKAYRDVQKNRATLREQDCIGIVATAMNAELVRHSLKEWCKNPVARDPKRELDFAGNILVACGLEPGCSTDYDTVLWAQKFQSTHLVNLSNIEKIYDGDPKKDSQARAYSQMTWHQLQDVVGKEWISGLNIPFDPMATQKARKLGLTLQFSQGTLENIEAVLYQKPLKGTVVTG